MRKIGVCFLLCMVLIGKSDSQTLRPGRLAVSADGNANDRDDLGATPMTLAMLAKGGVGLKSKLVHYEYNNHTWFNSSLTQKNDMTYSTLNGASRFGFNPSLFFSVIDNPSAAHDHLSAEINKSTSTNPLYILAMGPMDSVCRAIHNSFSTVRPYVTVISHSTWNENYQVDGSCTWAGVKTTGVKTIDIIDQNAPYFATNNYADVSWLSNHSDVNLRWVWSRMQISHTYYTAADISDAGETWYWLKYDQYGNFRKLKSYFECTAPTANRTIKICSPANSSTTGNTVHLQAQVADTGKVVVRVYVDGLQKLYTILANVDLNLTLADGPHKITVRALDSAGYFSTSVYFTAA